MMLASFNYSDWDIWLLPLFPVVVVGPFVLLFLDVRSFLKPDPYSKWMLFLIIALSALIIFTMRPWRLPHDLRGMRGYWLAWYWCSWITIIAFPVVLWWEARKNGWIDLWLRTKKRRKRKSS